jgi:cysteine desulfurase family protein (TIGR01976 family)
MERFKDIDFPIAAVRAQFPAVRDSNDFIFFDNAAGAQAPEVVLQTVAHHLLCRNVQRGGRYAQSREVDKAIAEARETVALFLNAKAPEEVAFGLNATSFIRLVSLAIGQSLGERREIIVTDLDHEANVATWLALERDGARIVWWKVREDGRLHPEDLNGLLSPRTRLVACTLASNAIGSITDVAEVSRLAHAAGAQVFLDAVHYGPHGVFDVQAWGCDYLVCSGYKIFSPHMGFLWGSLDTLNALPTFREDFIPDAPPWKIEAGTYTYENVAGMDAAIRYLEWLGRQVGPQSGSRRDAIVNAMNAITSYEQSLSREMLAVLRAVAGVRVYGVTEVNQLHLRTPTFSFTLDGVEPARVSEKLADAGIGVRDGHMYSPRLIRRLGLSQDSGTVRASLVHYNTVEEVRAFGAAVQNLASH